MSALRWTTSTSYDISGAGTYRVWAKDAAGNVSSSAGSIVAYTISRSQGAGSTLTTRYDSTSSSTGTAFSSNTAMLAGTSVWAKATANSGYKDATLKRGSTSMTASGASFTVSSSLTITSSATRSCSCPHGGTLQSDNTCDITTTSSTSYCNSCWVGGGTGEWCCDEDEECSAPSSDYYGGHWNDYWSNGGYTSYYCYYYDEDEEYVTSCSECGSTTSWTCSYGSLSYNGSSYGTCTYNATC